MSQSRTPVGDRPVRILFVYAWLAGGDEEREMRLLARTLDPARYRIDALPCARSNECFDPAHRELETLGVNVDTAARDLSFDETVRHLEGKLTGYEIVVSCQDVADIYPALERLRRRPPLIEYGRLTSEALSGPKHFTTRYVGMSETIRAAAASRMPDRPRHARVIPPALDASDDGSARACRATLGGSVRGGAHRDARSPAGGCSGASCKAGSKLPLIDYAMESSST